jgi:hypothetical protein
LLLVSVLESDQMFGLIGSTTQLAVATLSKTTSNDRRMFLSPARGSRRDRGIASILSRAPADCDEGL